MRIVIWVALAIFALTAIPAVLYFVLYILRGDDELRERAVRFYRWAVVVGLGTFNVLIFGHIIKSLLQIWGFIR